MERTKTLLELARSVPVRKIGRRKRATEQQMEVAVAWAKDLISAKQAMVVLKDSYPGYREGMTIYNLGLILKDAVRAAYLNDKKGSE